jgi:hypothetical protein
MSERFMFGACNGHILCWRGTVVQDFTEIYMAKVLLIILYL